MVGVARFRRSRGFRRATTARSSALGFVGYYLASYFDFLGLQYITAALERLLLFVHPTFVVLFSALLFARRITGRDVFAIVVSYAGIALVFGHDVATQPGNVVLGSFWVLLSALFYAAYLIGSGRIVHRVGTLRFATYAGLVSSAARRRALPGDASPAALLLSPGDARVLARRC